MFVKSSKCLFSLVELQLALLLNLMVTENRNLHEKSLSQKSPGMQLSFGTEGPLQKPFQLWRKIIKFTEKWSLVSSSWRKVESSFCCCLVIQQYKRRSPKFSFLKSQEIKIKNLYLKFKEVTLHFTAQSAMRISNCFMVSLISSLVAHFLR